VLEELLLAGALALPPFVKIEIPAAVCSFDKFTEDNDPYGEHDFGCVEHPTAKAFWKIDYYTDCSCSFGLETPHDPASSFRVLTVMLADEW
jgi:hypothetical protein